MKKSPPIPATGWRYPPRWEVIAGGNGASRPRWYAGPFDTYEQAHETGRALLFHYLQADWYVVRELPT